MRNALRSSSDKKPISPVSSCGPMITSNVTIIKHMNHVLKIELEGKHEHLAVRAKVVAA